jgi:hypothetical protein
MASTQLLRLFGPMQIGIRGERGPDLIAAMAVNHMDAYSGKPAGGGNCMTEHGTSGNLLQHLRAPRLHALAFAGGQNDDM